VKKTKKTKPKIGIWAKSQGCLIVILAIIFIIGLFVYFFYNSMLSTKFTENTNKLIETAQTKFIEYTELTYPNDVVLKHISTKKMGPNFSSDLILSVPNINSFIEDAEKKYEFKNLKMNYPKIDGNKEYNIIYSDLCGNLNDDKDLQVKNPDNLRDFCGDRDILISQIKKETELGIIMVIFPKEELVWVNYTGWF